MIGRALLALAAGGLAALALPALAPASASADEPTLTEVGCAELTSELGPYEDALTCGRVDVPLLHDEPEQGTLSLAVAVADGEALAGAPDPDLPDDHPLLLLGGGPGERVLSRIAPSALEDPARLGLPADGRDLVFVEQRGIAPSSPRLECDLAAPPLEGPWLPPEWPADDDVPDPLGAELEAQQRIDFPNAAAACADDYADMLAADDDLDVDVATFLSGFTTAESARDLDVVAQALDQDRLHLKGVSYGAKLALQAAAATPDTWETLTLASAISGQDNYLDGLPTNLDDTLERLEEACEADPGCGPRLGGSLAADLDAQVDAQSTSRGRLLAREALQVFYGSARHAAARIEALGDGRLEDSQSGRTRAPERADEPTPTATAPEPSAPASAATTSSGIELGMHLALTCNEEVRYGAFDEPGGATARALYRSSFVDGFYTREVCDAYQATGVDEDPFAEPIASPVPTLVVTGALDQVTPPSFADRVVDALEGAGTPYVAAALPDATHSPTTKVGRCGQELVEGFLAGPPTEADEDPAACAQDRSLTLDPVLSRVISDDVQRVAGPDRVATAADVSGWTFHGGRDVAYLAASDDFPDALAAGPIAGAQDAPVLLTGPDGLDAAAAHELTRLAPDQVVLLGGDAALSEQVADDVEALDAVGDVGRIEGPDRYATAVALATEAFPDGASTVAVATGEAFPDALAAGPLVAADRGPLLLTRSDGLPDNVAAALADLDPDRVVLLGGTSAVSQEVEGELEGLVGADAVDRIAGEDRYATAREIAVSLGAPRDEGYVASGEAFPDALAGTPLASGRGPLLLTRRDALPRPTAEAIEALGLDSAVLLGGANAVTDGVGNAVGNVIDDAR